MRADRADRFISDGTGLTLDNRDATGPTLWELETMAGRSDSHRRGGEGGDPDRDRAQHEAGRVPAGPDKG